MKKYLAFILLFFLVNFSFAQIKVYSPKEKYLFTGTIQGMDKGWLFIGHPDTTGKDFSFLDSSEIINGSFKFEGFIADPEPCIFVFKPGPNSFHLTSYFILDKGNLTGVLFKDSMPKSIIIGNSAQAQYQKFMNTFYNINARYYKEVAQLKNQDSTILENISAIENEKIVAIQKSIIEFPNSIVSAFIAHQYLPRNMEAANLESVYNLIGTKDNYYSKKIYSLLKQRQQTKIGVIAPAFNIIDNKNILLSNNSFAGKYYLLDFWASWCVPCRAENPHLLKAYKMFNNKGFDILSISIDKSKVYWENAVKQDKLLWRQARQLENAKNVISDDYGVNLIPMNFLIDPNGKVVEKNLRGNKLEIALRKYLHD